MSPETRMTIPKEADPVSHLQSWLRANWSRDLYVSGVEKISSYEQLAHVGQSRFTVAWDPSAKRYVGSQRRVGKLVDFEILSRPRVWELSGPGWKQLVERLEKKDSALVTHSERLIVRSAHEELVQIPAVQMALSPLRNLLVSMNRHGEVGVDKIRRTGKSAKQIENYLQVLSTLQFAKVERGLLLPGPRFKASLAEGSPKLFYDRVLTSVVQESLQFLRFALRFSQVVGYIRWANSYYLTAWDAGRAVTLPIDQLNGRYADYYGSFHRSDLEREGQLQRVADAGLLRWDEEGVTGEPDIANRYLKEAPAAFAALMA